MDKVIKSKDFLQSEEWRKFQEAVGKKTYILSYPQLSPFPAGGEDFDFLASVIEHKLPLVGRYFYIPRGIIFNFKFSIFNKDPIFNDQIKKFFSELINLAKKEKVGWIRFDANSEEVLKIVGNNLLGHQMSKAPHDMQPREVFVIDITKTEEELLKEMSSKTRYNVRLAKKKGVQVRIMNYELGIKNNYLEEFLRLVKVTSGRQGITAHPEEYYRKMFEVIPAEMIKLYVAEYEGKVIAANLVIFYGDTVTYLHGASDNAYRNVMAPYLLQWRAIQDAKAMGCVKYDFGGISTKYPAKAGPRQGGGESNTNIRITNNWQGITKFKIGFSPNTKPTEFPGSYDIVLNSFKYNLYRFLQKIKSFL